MLRQALECTKPSTVDSPRPPEPDAFGPCNAFILLPPKPE